MNRWRLLLAALIGAVATLVIGFGLQASASSSSSGSVTTIYACLESGKLKQVGTTVSTCGAGATAISWNSYPSSGQRDASMHRHST